MPFKSQAQRAFLFARHPSIAKRWAAEYGGGGKNLPKHVKPKRGTSVAQAQSRARRKAC